MRACEVLSWRFAGSLRRRPSLIPVFTLPLRFLLDTLLYLNKYRSIEAKSAVDALAALAQESRLGIFRTLVQARFAGVSAGKIGEAAGIAPSLLSFHLKELFHAGLIESWQRGRFIIYTARYYDGFTGGLFDRKLLWGWVLPRSSGSLL